MSPTQQAMREGGIPTSWRTTSGEPWPGSSIVISAPVGVRFALCLNTMTLMCWRPSSPCLMTKTGGLFPKPSMPTANGPLMPARVPWPPCLNIALWRSGELVQTSSLPWANLPKPPPSLPWKTMMGWCRKKQPVHSLCLMEKRLLSDCQSIQMTLYAFSG